MRKILSKSLNLSRLVKDHPNYVIFIAGAMGFVVFYPLARVTSGQNSDLLINLAVSSLIIAVTVLVVDAVRQKHQRLNVKGAAINGASKVQMANFSVVTILGDHHFHDLKKLQDEHLRNILKHIKTRKNYMDNYLVRLLNLDHEKLLDEVNEGDLRKLRGILTQSTEICDTVLDIYAYSFDNKLREHLISFRETVYYVAYSLSDAQLRESNGMTRASQMISIYLKKFQELQSMIKRL